MKIDSNEIGSNFLGAMFLGSNFLGPDTLGYFTVYTTMPKRWKCYLSTEFAAHTCTCTTTILFDS